MSGQILVNFATISGAGAEVRATAARIQSQLDELKAGVTKIAASWEGVAQQGYQAHQKKWDDKAADLQQVLSQIGSSLDQAASSYQETEQKNSTIWS
ncbi:WXG100 family type VII secretion target [Kitasatospora herbaricolor]|uniref:ESAT-6-like protein n=1 Tax=Kitasatospora herbaricolor TaxID=68217 RepID=A0ABZ1WD38_9ACTN|nr:WXG100 family type VII secretion target [Kitasatospora herbaricolor]